jgi:class 3 adenylate cyclase/tetratricopeptide (TPR) repeat protein
MRCFRCQGHNPAGARFCNSCGARLDAVVSAASPQAYTPEHLAERILTSRSAVEGERKQVTVLFADVKGSMELLADRDPEEARELLDAVVERMMEAVHRYEGTVNQVMGDGIMALFGAPLACEDHPLRACFAALRMQEAFTRYADELRRTHGLPLHIRVGLNSGEVVVRSVSTDLRMDYTAVGPTTHLAARMEQMAQPGSILITANTLSLAGDSVLVKSLGQQPVKGLDAPIEIFELVGALPARSMLRVAAVHKRSRFVARDAELAQLQRILADVERGQGRAVAVAGEAGVGKSRLVFEFINSSQAQAWPVLGSSALSYEKVASWSPLIDILRSYFEATGREAPEELSAHVAAKIRGLGAELEEEIAPILSLLDALPLHDPFRLLEGRERRQRLLDALTRVFLAESERQPLVLVLENLQWIDGESRAFLDTLIEQLPSARVLLLVNYRPEFEHDWRGKPCFTELWLEPLKAAAARELLAALLGDDRSLASLHQLLIQRSNGNPFFLEEIVRTLVETKAIVGEPGAWRLAAEVNTLHVPPTVQAVLAARIDRLPLHEKLLLQQASVIGADVPLALLEAVTEASGETIRRALASLQAAGFLHETSMFPDLEYRFRHILSRDVAYSSLLREPRRALHARAVKAMEALYADRLTAHLDALATHALRGEVWDKAVAYNRQLGMRALERTANGQAVHAFEAALGALTQLPPGRATAELEIDLRSALRPPLLQLGRLDDVLVASKQVEQLALQLGDEQRLAHAYTYLINYHYLKGETARTIEYGERCVAIAEARQDQAIQALARQYLGQSHHARGEYLLAERALQRNIDSYDKSSSVTSYVSSCAWLAFSLAERGEFDAAGRHAQDAQQVAEENGHAYDQMIALTFAGVVMLRRGQVARAMLPLQRSFEICRKRHLTVWQPVSSSLLGLAFVRMGNGQEALRLLEGGVTLSRELGVQAYLPAWISNLAEGLQAVGMRERALSTAHEALALAVSAGERGHEAYALWLLGEIEQAPGRYEDAAALARQLGMRPLLAQIQLDLARFMAARGDRKRAEEHLRQGGQLFGELGMRPWYDRSQINFDGLGHLFIVARTNPQLYEFLAEEFSGTRNVQVVLDRRARDRWDARKDTGERRRQQVDEDLRAWELAVTALQTE